MCSSFHHGLSRFPKEGVVRKTGSTSDLARDPDFEVVLSRHCVPILRAFDDGTLQGTIALREEANRKVALLNQTDLSRFDEIPSELLDDGFLAWLCALGTAMDERDEARSLHFKLERLEYCARLRNTEPPQALRGRRAGFVHIVTPIPQSVAEGWFLIDAQFVDHARELTEAFFAGECDWRQTVARARARTRVRLQSEAGTFAFIGFALLRNALINATPAQARSCLAQFRRLLDQAPMGALVSPERCSYVLRYALAALPSLSAVQNRRESLEDLVALMTQIIAETSSVDHPGIMRDALLSRARVRRELSRWVPTELEGAVSDFHAGLNVPGARYACEARGRALGDLATALAARPDRTLSSELEIERLLVEATSWCDGYPLNRATSLRNHAVFLNELMRGDRSENQERALSYVNLALDELALSEGNGNPGLLSVRELRAVILQTRGNILRARASGSRAENLQEAIEAYQSAMGALGSEAFAELRSDLRFCLACAYLDGQEPGNSGLAQQQLDEARRLAQTPGQRARIARSQADTWLASSVAVEGLATHLAAVEENLRQVTATGDRDAQARTMRTLAELLLVEPSAFSRERAAKLLAEAADLFSANRDLFPASVALQDLALVRLEQWRLTPGGRDLLQGAADAANRARLMFEALHRARIDPHARHRLSQKIGMLRTEHLWMEAQLGAPASKLWALSAARAEPELDAALRLRAIERQLPSHEAARVTLAERLLGIARSDYLRLRADAPSNLDLAQQLGAIRIAEADLSQTISEAGPSGPTALRGGNSGGEETRIEFHVAGSGTVALCSGPELPPDGIVVLLSFSGVDLMDLLVGDETAAWATAYARRAHAPTEWESAWVEALSVLRREVLEPVWRAIGWPARSGRVTLAPGALGSLPLEAIVDDSGRPWSESASSLVIVSATRAGQRHRTRPMIRRAVCILSDPGSGRRGRLAATAKEITEVATLLAAAGVATEVIASSGPEFGLSVFAREGLSLPEAVRVLDARPTPSWLQEHAPDCDLMLFAGHGSGGAFDESGLVLVDEAALPHS